MKRQNRNISSLAIELISILFFAGKVSINPSRPENRLEEVFFQLDSERKKFSIEVKTLIGELLFLKGRLMKSEVEIELNEEFKNRQILLLL